MEKKLSTSKIIEKLIDAIIFSLLIWVALFLIVYDSSIVEGESMQPTLNHISAMTDNDIVYYNKYCQYDYNDIIVINAGEENIIKRVIGKAGDKIRYQYNVESGIFELIRNGNVVNEPYIKKAITVSDLSDSVYRLLYEDATDSTGYNPLAQLKINQYSRFDGDDYIVPDGQVFVMGDNRLNSLDSKTHGGYDVKNVVGTVELIVRSDQNVFWEVIKFMFKF